ncbi:MAG: secondary thiamine-phosphate synthase enzyme YjbQ [Haloferacaceae archaeon]
MPTFEVTTDARLTTVDVTDRVEAALSPDSDGVATAFVRHTTAALVVNEAERRLLADVETMLDDLVPDEGWRHDGIDDNADAHLRTLLLGPDVTLPVTDGSLDLGTWQSVLLVECDGPRSREVTVRV